MHLKTLAEAVEKAGVVFPKNRPADVEVTGIAYDSREVRPGFLFVAVPGERHDGHDFLPAALDAGAAAVAVQADHAALGANPAVPHVVVPDARRALALFACRFYDDPTHHLFLAGVTGTNGKTTTTRLIDAIARAAGDTTGVIGTLGATIAGKHLAGARTTPEAPDLQQRFAQMREAGVRSAAIEVASHALAQGRTDGCAFDVGIWTNLTLDHLDFHQTMTAYQAAKTRLFTDYADTARAAGKAFTAVLNHDDAAGRAVARQARGRVLMYSAAADPQADIAADDIALDVDRITFQARTPLGRVPVTLGFGGAFNVANALAAIGYGIARGVSLETIAQGLAACPPVPGRFQPIRAGQDFAVLVDYAHTPDGLENVLRSARTLTKKRLIVVFGCGGDRDRTKRPPMGAIARRLADVAIVTSDNPRGENPQAIIDEIRTGMNGAGPGARVDAEADRRGAIALAVRQAEPGDTVVIAGKGHETYQIVGGQTLPFDDALVAAEEIARCSH